MGQVCICRNMHCLCYKCAPFGALTNKRGTSAASNPWRFSSEFAEDDTATIYYNYRHYEPETGRWMSRDRIEEKGDLNLYLYCRNNAHLYNDVQGESIAGAALGATAVAALIYAASRCVEPLVEEAKKRFSDSGDKFKHCWTSCRASETCGVIAMELAGLGKEVFDRGLRVYCRYYPNSNICIENGTTPFWDSIEDLIANHQCVRWETASGPVMMGVVNLIRTVIGDDCECCCRRRAGYDNGDI